MLSKLIIPQGVAMTEKEGLFSIPTRLLLTPEQREKEKAEFRARMRHRHEG